MRQRVIAGKEQAYDKDGDIDIDCKDKKASSDPKASPMWMGVVSWVQFYATCNGDYMPDRDKVVLPKIDYNTWWLEYCADMKYQGRPQCKYAYFTNVWHGEPMLERYDISNFKFNFENCKCCIKWSTAIASAKTALSRQQCKVNRQFHLQQCKAERMTMELTIRGAENGLVTCLAMDAWSIWTTTAPKFCIPIKGLKLNGGIALKVTGVEVHGPPGTSFLDFYLSDKSAPSDTNLNVECLRRALVKIHNNGGIRDKLYIQTDNAGVIGLAPAGAILRECCVLV